MNDATAPEPSGPDPEATAADRPTATAADGPTTTAADGPTTTAADGPTDLDYRRAVSWFATGVAVMTALTADGQWHGMTANAVTSVSLDPLLVLVCVDRDAGMSKVVQDGGVYALSFLAADQRDLSDHFASEERGLGDQEFDGVDAHTAVTGAPLLDGANAWLDCEVHDVLPGGDHLLVLGRVVHTAIADDADDALLYTPDGYSLWERDPSD